MSFATSWRPCLLANRAQIQWRKPLLISCKQQQEQQAPFISKEARIRDEVISPFRTFRMFVYPALIASGCIAALTSIPRLLAAIQSKQSPAAAVATGGTGSLQEVLQGLAIDVAAVVVLALLYRSDFRSREQALAKLSREESLASLRVELPNKRIVSLGQMQGSARFVIVAGPHSHVREALQRSRPFQEELLQRGVTVVPFVTSSDQPLTTPKPSPEPSPSDEEEEPLQWRATPVYTAEWSRWLSEQKKLANIPEDKPVYLSLRLDGRVRGSGVGFPPWSAFVAQLPPLKGMWRGALDGMDGRV